MLFKNKRRAIVAFRTLQDFADFCFYASRILTSKNSSQDKKIQVLKKFASFFVIDNVLPSIRRAEVIFEEEREGQVIQRNFQNPGMLFDDLKNFTDGYNSLLELFKKRWFAEICYFQAAADMAQRMDVPENEYFNPELEERLNGSCLAFMAFIPDFFRSTALITSLLGEIILKVEEPITA